MRINNKGFTLVELLAVLVILIAISSIAIPTISSSLERSKTKQDDSKKKLLVSAAELYVTDNRNAISDNIRTNSLTSCKIDFNELKNSGYIDDDATKSSNDREIQGCIIYDGTTCNYEATNCSQTNCKQ